MIALLSIDAAHATPPTPPVTVIIDERTLAEPPSRVLLVRVDAHEDVREVSLKVSVRRFEPDMPEFERPAARVLFEQTVEVSRKSRMVEVPLEGLEPGEYDLDIFITGRQGPNEGFSDRDLRHLTVAQDGAIPSRACNPGNAGRKKNALATPVGISSSIRKSPRIRVLMDAAVPVPSGASDKLREWDVPAERRLIVRPEGPAADLKEFYVEHEQTSWTSTDPVTVRGRVWFQDIDGAWKPLVNVSVNLWDEDTFGDEHLGTTVSDWDGRWTFSVNNDDGWLADGRDIYYSFHLGNSRLGVTKCSGDYRWSSSVRNDTTDGTVVDFGDETAGTDPNSLSVWAALNLAWNHVSTVGGQDPGKINTCFPSTGTFTDRSGVVNVAAGDFDSDGITHEYGHALMFAANGSDPSPGGAHNFGQCGQNTALSWSEGWATGFLLSVLPDNRFNWHFGDTGREIEAFNSSCKTGESSEGRVAASLLDMLDSNNDSNGTDENLGRNSYGDNNASQRIGLASMFRDTMWGESPSNDSLQFWYALSGEIASAQRNPGQEVMYYNWMSVLAPDSCVATKVSTASLKEPEPVLAGVRRFRDLLLKPVPDGRELINSYYRNSPEMGLLLLKNPAYIEDSLRVLQHFGAMGNLIADNKRYREAVELNTEVLSPEVRQSIERLMELFGQRGGETLSADTRGAMKAYEAVKTLRLVELQENVGRLKQEGATRPFVRLKRGEFTPESRKALQDRSLRNVRSFGLPTPPKR